MSETTKQFIFPFNCLQSNTNVCMYNVHIYDNILEVNSQTKYELYIFIETLQIVLSMCSLQMSMFILFSYPHSTVYKATLKYVHIYIWFNNDLIVIVVFQGSSTQPGCWETVTWILYNKPAYITKQQLELFYR